MAETARYEAFISYSHADEAWAGWLHRALERYRLPRALAGELGRSRRLRRIFRDRDELFSGELTGKIQAALDASDALIVVCSPNAAASRWVNDEIEYFLARSGSDRVFCLLVDDDAGASFPPALGAERIAADPRPKADGRSNARLKLLAGLLDIDFDTLRQRDRQWQRRRTGIQLGALTGSAALAAAAVYLALQAPPCRDRNELLAEIWGADRRAAVAEAIHASGLPYAADAWRQLEPILGRYADDWAGTHEDACLATRVRKEQSAALMDLRMACLAERKSQFSALLDGFVAADTGLLENAVSRASRLRPLARCADRDALEAAFPPPEDPEVRARVDAAFSEIAATQLLLDGSEVDAAMDSAISLARSAESFAYPPLTAEALMLLGNAYRESGDLAAAEDAYFDAAASAAAANDAELAAEAWLALPYLLAAAGETQNAARMLRFAQTYVAKLPEAHPLVARYHNAMGVMLTRSGRASEGVTELRTAVDLQRPLGGAALTEYLSDLAWCLRLGHEFEEAGVLAAEVATLTAGMFGEIHPATSRALADLAEIEAGQGNNTEAVRLYERAIAVAERVYPDTHPRLASLLQGLGWQLISTGELKAAVTAAERAIDINLAQREPQWPLLGSAHNVAGDALLSAGEYDAARLHFEAAIEAWRRTDNAFQLSVGFNNLGNLSNREGRFDLAIAECTEALNMDSARLEPDDPELAYPLSCLGEAYLGRAEYQPAIETLSRANALREAAEVTPGALAWSRWLLGRALWESGTDPAAAKSYLSFARDVFVELGDGAASERQDLESWLAARQIDL
ncbi:MAG: tetratricopeptide repeat protein [Pseudomonadales bacterium]